jgi:CRP-like cAMP-binding protein
MNPIRNYLSNFVPLSDEEWNDFNLCLAKDVVPKKTMIIKEGQRCDFIAFVVGGIFKFYHVKEGEEKITAFFSVGDVVTNYRSFLTGNPSEHYIEAISDSTIFKITRNDLLSLYEKHRNFDRLGRLIAENVYLDITKRLDSFLNLSPENRYKELLNRNSRLLHEVPQYMIASYLGVKPETLSRIRAKM